ncbi:DsbA family protein [Streptomyces sodiiphilus]|uniref:DsbA family protein n=1 Tax=Streptomyces sodiiphilus TaxID=226217 RepID=A0ABN2PET8_9ACTN
MSKRNTQEAKRAARERLKQEREQQAKREKLRRQLVVALSAVGVLAIAAAIGLAVANAGGGGDETDWEAVSAQLEEDGDDADYPVPAHASGEGGLTVLIGDENAENTFTLYEDPRCPSCAGFEQNVGPAVHEGIDNGEFNVEFVFGTFLDNGPNGGTGSKNAVSALGAALDVSPEAFLGFKDALYSEDFHPGGGRDDFGDDDRILEIASTVDELDGNQQFEDAVRDSTFAAWALKMSEKFDADPDVSGTPSVKLNGEMLDTPQDAAGFRALFEANRK